MVHAIEFHGRLCRADGQPENPGLYDLLFRLHANPDGETALWEDDVRGIAIALGGYYHTVLGAGNALHAQLFDGSPRFLSVRVVRDGRLEPEAPERVPLIGVLLTVAEGLRRLETRVGAVEAGTTPHARRVTKRMSLLRRRIRSLEAGEGALAPLLTRLALVEARLARIDGAEGRVARIEDELEDIVGPDGDVVDLTERMDALEKRLARG